MGYFTLSKWRKWCVNIILAHDIQNELRKTQCRTIQPWPHRPIWFISNYAGNAGGLLLCHVQFILIRMFQRHTVAFIQISVKTTSLHMHIHYADHGMRTTVVVSERIMCVFMQKRKDPVATGTGCIINGIESFTKGFQPFFLRTPSRLWSQLSNW